jgi:hypothetical protein
MKPAVLLAIILSSIVPALGGKIVITSPDHARTFAYGAMIWHQLYVDPTNGVLTARITFSNLPYVSDNDPRLDESFEFRFPGVHADQTHHALLARARHGEQIAVARIQGGSTCGSVDLAAGARIYLLKESGRVTAVLIVLVPGCAGFKWMTTGLSRICLPVFSDRAMRAVRTRHVARITLKKNVDTDNG